MGFKDVKKQVIAALQAGTYQHEARGDIAVKNLLAMNAVTVTDVIGVLARSRGQDYTCTPHHHAASIDVHLIVSGGWYIKFYVIEPDTWFISIHQ